MWRDETPDDSVAPGTLLRAPMSLRTVVVRYGDADAIGDTMLHMRVQARDDVAPGVELTTSCDAVLVNCCRLWSAA